MVDVTVTMSPLSPYACLEQEVSHNHGKHNIKTLGACLKVLLNKSENPDYKTTSLKDIIVELIVRQTGYRCDTS